MYNIDVNASNPYARSVCDLLTQLNYLNCNQRRGLFSQLVKQPSPFKRTLISDFTASNNSIYKYINYLRNGGNISSTVYHGLNNATSDEDRANLSIHS